MKHVAKHVFVLGVTALALVMEGAVAPVRLAAQEVEPPTDASVWQGVGRTTDPAVLQSKRRKAEAPSAPTVLQPSAFANEHRMVFESYRDGQYEIYAADGDGGGATRLTTSGSTQFPKLRLWRIHRRIYL